MSNFLLTSAISYCKTEEEEKAAPRWKLREKNLHPLLGSIFVFASDSSINT